MDHPNQLPTVLSLCTGYGGIERGLSLAGFEHRVVAHVETEAFAIANLVAKMETGQLVPAPIWTDLKTLPAQCFRERIDVLTGGYPCQGFSTSGLRKGSEDPRYLWGYIRGHIESIRPVRCFFENVEGHISLGLREVIKDLESLGYKTQWGIFSASECGAPHQRKRVFILAHANSQRGRSGNTTRENATDAWQPSSDKGQEPRGMGNWDFEPDVGRVAYGSAFRVDRLRLLGNGVVPQTAAKAWIILNEEMDSEGTTKQ